MAKDLPYSRQQPISLTLNNKTNDTDKTKATGTENQRTKKQMGNLHIAKVITILNLLKTQT
jgi:hypothetical protein